VQAAKAGVLEIGDIFLVNKADRPGADEQFDLLLGCWRCVLPRRGSRR